MNILTWNWIVVQTICLFLKGKKGSIFYNYHNYLLYLTIVDLWCINFRCIAKWFSHIYIFVQILRLLFCLKHINVYNLSKKTKDFLLCKYAIYLIFPGGSDGKESSCDAGDRIQSLCQEDHLENGIMATHSSILA